jgi:hypothetical protein
VVANEVTLEGTIRNVLATNGVGIKIVHNCTEATLWLRAAYLKRSFCLKPLSHLDGSGDIAPKFHKLGARYVSPSSEDGSHH